VGKQRYAIAATAIDRSIRLENKEIVKSINQEAFRFNDTEVPLIRLRTAFSSNTANNKIPEVTYAVIINADSEKIAFAVDAVKETVETVIRPLPRLLKDSHMFSGVAVVGDGTSVLLINPRGFSNAE
jgi:two-component system chemotaxis sensor kinase CheA